MFQLISPAFAQDAAETATAITATAADATATAAAAMPQQSMGEAFTMNMLLVLMVVVLFYFLVIKPQQKRMKDHADMVSKLGKGERVVMQGGLIGTLTDEGNDHEVTLDCNGTKVSVLRTAIMGKFDEMVRPVAGAPVKPAANDDSAKAAKGKKKSK